MDILSLWKQLPASNIVNTVDNTENEKKVPWVVQIGGVEEREGEEDNDNDRKEPEFWTVDPKPTPTLAETVEEPEQEPEPEQKKDTVDIDILGRWPKPFDIEPWIQCNICDKWFKTKEIRSKHAAKYHLS